SIMNFIITCSLLLAFSFTATSAIEHPNCGNWNKNATLGFCASPAYTLELKKEQCSTTCAFEINPTADCRLYTSTGTAPNAVLTPETPSKSTDTTGPGTPVKSGASFPTGANTAAALAFAFVKKDCTLTLFTEADTSTTHTTLKP
ncbi:hypothetical protein PMAYCL1PPCAC_10632, partial [Pristionchus mayeri]